MPFSASTAFEIAVNCGTPTPVTIRVVQIEPGPIPTLTASTPASASALHHQLLQHYQQQFVNLGISREFLLRDQ